MSHDLLGDENLMRVWGVEFQEQSNISRDLPCVRHGSTADRARESFGLPNYFTNSEWRAAPLLILTCGTAQRQFNPDRFPRPISTPVVPDTREALFKRLPRLLRKLIMDYSRNAGTRRLLIALALLVGAVHDGSAQERSVTPRSESAVNAVKLQQFSQVANEGEQYVIVHGLGGLSPKDRFHALAEAIRTQCPDSTVFLINWSQAAKSGVAGVAVPWRVAKQIDAVALESSQLLRKAGLDPTRTTVIGESFGVYVNAQIAKHLGGVHRCLAFNPASLTGGYWPPDLKTHSTQAWSFHTWSFCDTACVIADADFFLETPTEATHVQQHVSGIPWLTARLQEGDTSWLMMNKVAPARQRSMYSAQAKLDGTLSAESITRVPPKPPAKPASPTSPSPQFASAK